MSLYKGDKLIAGTSVKQSHNIGDIFFTSRTDTVLVGAVECNGATYQTTSYTGEGSIGELLAAGKLPYISLSEYATYLTTHNNICGVFGWNGGSSTAFRVPLLKDVFIEATRASDNQLGWNMAAGLPNITGGFNAAGYSDNVSNLLSNQYGAFARGALDTTDSGCNFTGNTGKRYNTNFDASRSSSIYGNSSTVQPNSVKYRAMVQLYNAVTDEALATCENVESDVQSLKTTLNNKITNCITYIPQDIKLELNNGMLILRAGSKVYVPNGVGVFDVKNITTDITGTISNNSTYLLCVQAGGNAFDYVELVRTYSGTTNPGQTYSFWYDTTSNLVKLFIENTSTPARTESLPIAIFTVSNGIISSIDQVFNGFGYIGSTVFALPGVKGLIPNGRNADGSLKNTEFTVSRVLTRNDFTWIGYDYIGMWAEGIGTDEYIYNEEENFNYSPNGYVKTAKCVTGPITINGKITSFLPKTVFHALDYNDTESMTIGALSNIVNGANTKVGDVYYTSAANNTSVYAPSGGKWLVLYVVEVNISNAVLYLFSDDLYHRVGEIVNGGMQITQARSGYGAYVSLLKIS